MQNTLPGRRSSNACLLTIDAVPVNWSSVAVNVNVGDGGPEASLPEVSAGPEGEHDWESEVGDEEALSVTEMLSEWGNGNVELWFVS